MSRVKKVRCVLYWKAWLNPIVLCYDKIITHIIHNISHSIKALSGGIQTSPIKDVLIAQNILSLNLL
jgi:hypothetical protein